MCSDFSGGKGIRSTSCVHRLFRVLFDFTRPVQMLFSCKPTHLTVRAENLNRLRSCARVCGSHTCKDGRINSIQASRRNSSRYTPESTCLQRCRTREVMTSCEKCKMPARTENFFHKCLVTNKFTCYKVCSYSRFREFCAPPAPSVRSETETIP